MNEQLLLLLRSVPKDHILRQIIESVVLPELQFPVKIEVWAIIGSKFENFSGIYRRRYQHLTMRGIKSYGFLESIPTTLVHREGMQVASIHTKNYQGYIWMDLDFKTLIGLAFVAKQA